MNGHNENEGNEIADGLPADGRREGDSHGKTLVDEGMLQVGVLEKVFECLTINIIFPILKKTANKERILRGSVGFHRITWALMMKKILLQTFGTHDTKSDCTHVGSVH